MAGGVENARAAAASSKNYMKTILVLSAHPDFAENIRVALTTDDYRIVHRTNLEDSEPLLIHGLVSACVLDADLLGVESICASTSCITLSNGNSVAFLSTG